MSDSRDDIPTFDDLVADPEIAALLDFAPVPRKREVEGGWTPEKQREFIARMAVHGSIGKACDEMAKHRNGFNKLFNHPHGASFRAAVEGAVALAKRRWEEGVPAAEFVQPGARPPTIDHRFKHGRHAAPSPGSPAASPPSPARAEGAWAHDASPDARWEVLVSIFNNYAVKLEAERRARLAGRIAEADLCVRQLTFLEVAIDLASGDAFTFFRDMRRDGHGVIDIAETDASRILDDFRRAHFEDCGDPPRPGAPPSFILQNFGTLRTDPGESYGALSHPAEGCGAEEWDGTSIEEQQARRQAQYARAAEEQIEWEAKARADWEARQSPPPSACLGEGHPQRGEGVDE